MVQSAFLNEYQVVGRKKPTETDPNPSVFRMRVFTPNEVAAKSRFWYVLKQTHKLKKASGEILAVHKVRISSALLLLLRCWCGGSRVLTHICM